MSEIYFVVESSKANEGRRPSAALMSGSVGGFLRAFFGLPLLKAYKKHIKQSNARTRRPPGFHKKN